VPVHAVIQLCEPMVSLLRLVDGGVLQHVGKMDSVPEEDRQTVKTFLEDRWAMLHTDMHSAGFVLDPEYNFEAYSQSTNDEVMSGFCNILEKFYPGNVPKQSQALHS